MKYVVVMNGCAGDLAAQARDLNDVVGRPGFPGQDGTTVLLHAGEAPLPLVPTPSAIRVRVSRYQPEQVLDILEELAPRLEAGLYLFGDDLAEQCAHQLDLARQRIGGATGADGLRLRLALVLHFVQLARQFFWRPIGQLAFPELHRDVARAAGDAGAVQRAEVRRELEPNSPIHGERLADFGDLPDAGRRTSRLR